MRGDSVNLSPTICTPSGPPFSPIVGDRGMILHVCRLIHTYTHCDGYLYGSGQGSNLSPVSPTVCCGVLLMAVLILGDAEGIAQFARFIPHYPPPSPTRCARSTDRLAQRRRCCQLVQNRTCDVCQFCTPACDMRESA